MAMNQGRSRGVDPFMKLVHKIARECTQDDLDGLKLMCSKTIPEGDLEDIKPMQFFMKLIRFDLLTAEDFDWLKDALPLLGKQHLIKHIEAYEKEHITKSDTETASSPPETPENYSQTPENYSQTPEKHSQTPEKHSQMPEEHSHGNVGSIGTATMTETVTDPGSNWHQPNSQYRASVPLQQFASQLPGQYSQPSSSNNFTSGTKNMGPGINDQPYVFDRLSSAGESSQFGLGFQQSPTGQNMQDRHPQGTSDRQYTNNTNNDLGLRDVMKRLPDSKDFDCIFDQHKHHQENVRSSVNVYSVAENLQRAINQNPPPHLLPNFYDPRKQTLVPRPNVNNSWGVASQDQYVQPAHMPTAGSIQRSGHPGSQVQPTNPTTAGSIQRPGHPGSQVQPTNLPTAGSIQRPGHPGSQVQPTNLNTAGSIQRPGHLGSQVQPTNLTTAGSIQRPGHPGSQVQPPNPTTAGSIQRSGHSGSQVQPTNLPTAGSIQRPGHPGSQVQPTNLNTAGSIQRPGHPGSQVQPTNLNTAGSIQRPGHPGSQVQPPNPTTAGSIQRSGHSGSQVQPTNLPTAGNIQRPNQAGARAITNRNTKTIHQCTEPAIIQPALGLHLTKAVPESAAHEADGGPASASPLSAEPFVRPPALAAKQDPSQSPLPAPDDTVTASSTMKQLQETTGQTLKQVAKVQPQKRGDITTPQTTTEKSSQGNSDATEAKERVDQPQQLQVQASARVGVSPSQTLVSGTASSYPSSVRTDLSLDLRSNAAGTPASSFSSSGGSAASGSLNLLSTSAQGAAQNPDSMGVLKRTQQPAPHQNNGQASDSMDILKRNLPQQTGVLTGVSDASGSLNLLSTSEQRTAQNPDSMNILKRNLPTQTAVLTNQSDDSMQLLKRNLLEESAQMTDPVSIESIKTKNNEQLRQYLGQVEESVQSNRQEMERKYQLRSDNADQSQTEKDDDSVASSGSSGSSGSKDSAHQSHQTNKLKTDSGIADSDATEVGFLRLPAHSSRNPRRDPSERKLAPEKSRFDMLREGKPLPGDLAKKRMLLMEAAEQKSEVVMDKDEATKRHQVETKKVMIDQLAKLKKAVKTTVPIQLYNYQLELASAALQGHNCIICAPTGSGKTLTAGYVCFNMWQKAKQQQRPLKALFIVCIRNLINQQKDALRQLFKQTDQEDSVIDGINETIKLKDMLCVKDVVVLTAQILVNALKSKELTLRDVDLLIMDECHHTNLQHPYNIIMQNYHEEKRRSVPGDRPLPQILGLTASLGVGANKDNALTHYILMCANLDCTKITHVRKPDNIVELLKHNPKPKKDQIIAVKTRDPNDLFFLILTYLMQEIETVTPLLGKLKPQRATQQYENWIVERRMDAEKRDSQDAIYGCQTLHKLNSTLMFYDELQAREVLPILKEHFSVRSEEPRDLEQYIYQFYDQQKDELQMTADAETIDENPKLERLSQLLHDLYTTKPQSKGILLTRTRVTVEGLVSFVKRQKTLKGLVKPAKFVGQGRREGTMTDTEQEMTLLLFKEDYSVYDSVNLLVATDVAQEGLDMPQCNFVIRYNFVSNEIGSVQSKGRARAKNSECYLIVNRNSTNEIREYENLEKEHSMLEALEDIDKKDPDKMREEILKKQERLLEELQIRRQNKATMAALIDSAQVTVHCKNCKLMLCRGSDMRKRGSNFIVIDPEFEDKIEMRKRERELAFRYDSHIGYLFCGERRCQRQLGPKIQYLQGTRLYGYALSKDAAMWKFDSENEYRQIKQWSKVPFKVDEEAVTD